MKSTALANRLLILGLVLTGLASAAAADDPESLTTVVLVRHAEKVLGVDDPPLTEDGKRRAYKLVHVLGGLEVDTIFSTPYKRTWATAKPLAKALGQEIVETPVTSTYVEDLARRIRDEHAGDVVVVVAHSNTVPETIHALGVAEAPAIPDDDYDNLFVVTFSKSSEPRLLALRFGRESP